MRRLLHIKNKTKIELTFPNRCPTDGQMESPAVQGNYCVGEATRTVLNSRVGSASQSCIGYSRGSVDALVGGLDSHARESISPKSASAEDWDSGVDGA